MWFDSLQDIFFGTGNLADLLPDVEAEQYYDDMQQQHEEEGTVSEDLDNAAGPAAGRSGSLAGSDRSLTPYNSSQYPLLEETEPDQHTQLPRDKSALSGKTQLALRWGLCTSVGATSAAAGFGGCEALLPVCVRWSVAQLSPGKQFACSKQFACTITVSYICPLNIRGPRCVCA